MPIEEQPKRRVHMPKSIIEQCAIIKDKGYKPASISRAKSYARNHLTGFTQRQNEFVANLPKQTLPVSSKEKSIVSKPIHELTNKQAYEFAMRQALEASDSIRMSVEEIQQYAAAVYWSIRYFNDRDPKHKEYMRFVEECRRAREEAILRKKQEILSKQKPDLIVK